MDSHEVPMKKEALYVEENGLAEDAIEAHDLPRAAKICIDIVEKDPANWRAFNTMGIISWTKNAWEDAYTMFMRSVELKPDYIDALINLFDAALKLKRVHMALPVFKKALELVPDNEEIKTIVENIELQGEDIYYTIRALSIGAYNPQIEEANKLLENGEINKAMATYLEINDTLGPNADVYCGLGIISYYQKRYEDAFSLFLESIKLNPVNPDTYLNLIDAARECEQIDKAREIYEFYCNELPGLKQIEQEFETIATLQSGL